MSFVAILGLGSSGEAAARLALAQGADVHVSDLRTDPATSTRADQLRKLGADVELGAHDVARIAGADPVIVSPGIPPSAAVLVELRERGVRWISEPEYAARFYRGALIAITGTNGKSSVTLLVGHLLQTAGISAAVGGNVGAGLAPAASDLARLEPAPDWVVLEMSSFQLADVERFAPDIGVVTSLAPDHLDRYPSVEAYWADKARLFERAHDDSCWVLADQAEVLALAGDAPGHRYVFSASDAPEAAHELHAFMRDGVLTLRLDDREEALLPRDELPLLGRHNVANALAAALVARLAGADLEGLRAGLRSATSLPHRMEPVGEHVGALWVNDSKATNVGATLGAIASLERPLVLLLGGFDKGENVTPLARPAAERARAVIVFGAAGERFERELRAAWPNTAGAPAITRVAGFEQALERAENVAEPGDVVLLSPACSSFDEFTNYEERGRAFAAFVRERAA